MKENYFGASQTPFEFDASKSSMKYSAFDTPAKETASAQDARYYRPMHANITIVLLDIRAELTKVVSHHYDQFLSLHYLVVFAVDLSFFKLA